MIVLPFEVLTLTGYKEVTKLNTIFDKICTYNFKTKTLTFQTPIAMYVMPVFFRCLEMASPSTSIILDESQYNIHKGKHKHSFKIEDRHGTSSTWRDQNFLMSATHAQCYDVLCELFMIDRDEYCPLLEGEYIPTSFEEASIVQTIALFAGQKVTIRCTFADMKCVLNEDEDLQIQHVPISSKTFGVNLCVEGGIVVRTCKQVSPIETVFTLFIV